MLSFVPNHIPAIRRSGWGLGAIRTRPATAGDFSRPQTTGLPAVTWQAPAIAISRFGLFLALHVPLAIAMERFSLLATVHALVCWIGGIACAFAGMRPDRILGIAGYIAASEVLWRATQAQVFYEGGKYAIAAVFLASLIRLRLRRIYWPAAVYFVLLLPSILLTVAGTNLPLARGLISFTLSGPLALAMSIIYLRQTRVTPSALIRVLGLMLGPLLGLAALCSVATFGSDDISFDSTESNFQTSAGFGPNQVSCVLGWAIVCAFLWVTLQKRSFVSQILAISLMLFCAMQAALTFSRSGIWMGAIGVMIASFFLMRTRRTFVNTAGVAVLAMLLAWLVVLPALDRFTGGQVSNRFAEKGFSNREAIATLDLILFAEHPVMGVGPGMGKYARKQEFGSGGAAHTEFTRLLSEHGIFGVIATLILFGIALRQFLLPGTPQAKALRVTTLAYSFAFMAAASMRVALPGFVMGLAFITLAIPGRRRSFPATPPTTNVASRSGAFGGLQGNLRLGNPRRQSR